MEEAKDTQPPVKSVVLVSLAKKHDTPNGDGRVRGGKAVFKTSCTVDITHEESKTK